MFNLKSLFFAGLVLVSGGAVAASVLASLSHRQTLDGPTDACIYTSYQGTHILTIKDYQGCPSHYRFESMY